MNCSKINIESAFVEGMHYLNNKIFGDTCLSFYLELVINEMKYHFTSAPDRILYTENENACIYFENERSTKFGWINFKGLVPDQPGLIEFLEPAANTFLLLYKKPGEVYPSTITEYGNNKEFIRAVRRFIHRCPEQSCL